MPTYTTDALISLLKARINVPTSQGLYSDADFLTVLDNELHGRVVPFYLSNREDYFLASVDYSCVAGQLAYDIPKRAIGLKLSDVDFYWDNTSPTPAIMDMTIVSPNERNDYGYYIKGEQVYLSKEKTNGYLRVSYYRRPAYLAQLTDIGVVQSINTGTNEVTLVTMPGTYTTSLSYDMVSSKIPFTPLADDVTPTSIVGNVMTFSSLPSTLAAGDYICQQYTAPVAQIPVDAINYLIACGAVRLLQGSNYQSAYQIAIAELTRIESDLKFLITPRTDRDPRKFSNRPFSTYPSTYYKRWARI